jgi:hypothetical protein
VLVILGLLTGGILTGQNLIRAAELRAVYTKIQRYQTAIYTFRDKYFALPGDMTNAYDFWGAAAGCTDALNSNSVPEGCNGNGDGKILEATASGEDLRAVQFLAMAGLIEGSYTGVIAPSGNRRQRDVNMPAGPIGNSIMWFNHLSAGISGREGTTIWLALEGATYPAGNVLEVEEMWNIDKKVDDGMPLQGNITSTDGNSACHDGTDYRLDAAGVNCMLVMWLDR